jgi:hypothetical protein
MLSVNMTLIFQVKQRPIIVVASKIHASSTSAITTIRTAIGLIFHVAKVHGSSATLTRAAIYFYVVDEIRVSHIKKLKD